MNMTILKIALLAFSFVITLLMSGCCTRNKDGTETCDLISCDSEVTGYAVFSNGTSPTSGADIILQWSDDSFVAATHDGVGINNSQGMLVVPYKFNAYYKCGEAHSIQVRAFESINRSGRWKLGDIVGRHDDTPTGNSTLKSESVTSSSGLLINLDGNGAQ